MQGERDKWSARSKGDSTTGRQSWDWAPRGGVGFLLAERGLEEGRTGSAGSAREGQRSQALAPRLADPAGARRPRPLGRQLGLSEECGRGTRSEMTTHTVHGEDLGPDEDEQGPQLPGRALEQFQHVREDAHGQGLRESRASVSQGHAWEGDGNGCALLPARGFP